MDPSLLDLMPAPAADGSLDEDAASDAFAEWAQRRGLALYPAQEEAMIGLRSSGVIDPGVPASA